MNYSYKHAISATMVLAEVLALPSTAQSLETSANVTLTTDYKFRGISQNESNLCHRWRSRPQRERISVQDWRLGDKAEHHPQQESIDRPCLGEIVDLQGR